ncbi:hypothetical protein MHEL_59760 [Mycolicibacterium helvum]|uniref:Uncharacterized protein n=1 Tax=Mycolicibacterium helvum TaxID=1534349 RepID=A0A7I7TGA0_9MYCO|nr:hypothetical protein MHEL_59760 [Mycolicibacterium helvum]
MFSTDWSRSVGIDVPLAAKLHHVSKLDRPFGIGLTNWVARAHDAGVIAATQVIDRDARSVGW